MTSTDAVLDPKALSALRSRMLLVLERAHNAARRAGRDPKDTRIMLATKSQPPGSVSAAIKISRELIGYSLGAESRVEALTGYRNGICRPDELHFIGHLQTNKVARALDDIDLLQTVDRLRLVEVLDRRLAAANRTLDIFVQVNVSGEPSKSGVAPNDARTLVAAVTATKTLRLKGFMTIGLNSIEASAVRAGYAALRQLRDEVVASGIDGTQQAIELSMGMSRDLELAIAEGATIVRVGTAIFGERAK